MINDVVSKSLIALFLDLSILKHKETLLATQSKDSWPETSERCMATCESVRNDHCYSTTVIVVLSLTIFLQPNRTQPLQPQPPLLLSLFCSQLLWKKRGGWANMYCIQPSSLQNFQNNIIGATLYCNHSFKKLLAFSAFKAKWSASESLEHNLNSIH